MMGEGKKGEPSQGSGPADGPTEERGGPCRDCNIPMAIAPALGAFCDNADCPEKKLPESERMRRNLADALEFFGVNKPKPAPGFATWWDRHCREWSYSLAVEPLVRDACEDAWDVATGEAEDILHAWAARRGYVVGPKGLRSAEARHAPGERLREPVPDPSPMTFPLQKPSKPEEREP